VSILYIVTIVFYLKVELIINGKKQELIIIKELFGGPVGDYCIACNTIKCMLSLTVYGVIKKAIKLNIKCCQHFKCQ